MLFFVDFVYLGMLGVDEVLFCLKTWKLIPELMNWLLIAKSQGFI